MKRLNNDMYACGESGLPETMVCAGRTWRLEQTFKHDFFACTGMYQCAQSRQRCVLKVNRLQSFGLVPLAGIGRFLRNRELKIIRRLEGIDQIPTLLGTYGRNGLVYQYIEGKSLDESPVLPNSFFFMLNQLIEKIHARDVCYMDLNKRGNILIGTDDRPYLIDFQISLCLSHKRHTWLRQKLQKADHYHLLKHKRRFRPDLLTDPEWTLYRRPSRLIRIHRCIGYPFRSARRFVLRFLYKNNILTPRSGTLSTPENDHRRFLN